MEEENLITCDLILKWLKEQVENKRIIPPSLYLDVATKLNILRSDEDDLLIEIEHQLAVQRAKYVNEGGTSAAAKILLEANPLFKDVRKQKAKLKQIEEAIRIGKLAARIKDNEMREIKFGQI